MVLGPLVKNLEGQKEVIFFKSLDIFNNMTEILQRLGAIYRTTINALIPVL